MFVSKTKAPLVWCTFSILEKENSILLKILKQNVFDDVTCRQTDCRVSMCPMWNDNFNHSQDFRIFEMTSHPHHFNWMPTTMKLLFSFFEALQWKTSKVKMFNLYRISQPETCQSAISLCDWKPLIEFEGSSGVHSNHRVCLTDNQRLRNSGLCIRKLRPHK